MKNNYLPMIIIAVLVAAGAFFAGMKYQESKRSNLSSQFGEFQRNRTGGIAGMSGANGNRMDVRPVNGDIISSDDKSITVKMTDGSSKIILVSDKTQINKAEKATLADLKTGEKVAVFGSKNSDGSVTAQNIQLNPVLRVKNNDQNPPTVNPK